LRRCSVLSASPARARPRRRPPAPGSAPSPSSTALAPASTATPISTRPSPTASSCRVRTAPTGRRILSAGGAKAKPPAEDSCPPGRSPPQTWPRSPNGSAAA
jgi:hypothetical protein